MRCENVNFFKRKKSSSCMLYSGKGERDGTLAFCAPHLSHAAAIKASFLPPLAQLTSLTPNRSERATLIFLSSSSFLKSPFFYFFLVRSVARLFRTTRKNSSSFFHSDSEAFFFFFSPSSPFIWVLKSGGGGWKHFSLLVSGKLRNCKSPTWWWW